jgi:hypothetical protein
MPWKKCTTAVGKSKLINAYKHKKVFKTTKKYPAPSDWIRTYEISSNEGRCQTVEVLWHFHQAISGEKCGIFFPSGWAHQPKATGYCLYWANEDTLGLAPKRFIEVQCHPKR